MSKFVEVLESITSKKVIRPKVSVFHDGTVGKGELSQLALHLKKSIWHGVKRIKSKDKLSFITTNDIDENGKLYPDYLEKRKRIKKKEENSPGWGKKDWR